MSIEVTEEAESTTETPTQIAKPPRFVKKLLRDEFKTRRVKYLFIAVFAALIVASAVWIAQQTLPNQPGTMMGTVVGYFAMATFAAAVIAVGVAVLAKSLFLVGRGFSTKTR